MFEVYCVVFIRCTTAIHSTYTYSFYIFITEQLVLCIKTKLAYVGLYENAFFALLAKEDACSVGIAYTATFIESFFGKCDGNIRKGRIDVR